MAQKLRVEGRLSNSEARRLLVQLASALASAHRRGIVHRDVQLANILCDEETPRCLLADFGIAAILASADDSPVKITESGELVGDPVWMSPEQLKDEEVTERSDIYSLGLVGYHILTEESPYDTSTRQELYSAHVEVEPRKLSALRQDVDPDLEALLERCLAKEPRQRPSATHIVRELAGETVPGPAAATFFERLAERRVPHWLAAYLAGGFGLIQLVEMVTDRRPLGPKALDITIASYLIGAPAVVILTWFHGKAGRQRFKRLEYLLLGAVALIWLAVIAAILIF